MKVQIPEAFAELFQPADFKAYYGGRGSAKSHSFATALLILGTQRPMRILCAREIQNSIKESVKELLDAKIADLGLGGFYRSTETDIRSETPSWFPSDKQTRFFFRGLRANKSGGTEAADSLKSTEGLDVVWVEEANTVSYSSLEKLMPTVRKGESEGGSEIWFSWNPRSPKDPVDAMFRGGEPPPRSIVRRVNWHDNPWFTDKLQRHMEWLRTRDAAACAYVYGGEYQVRSEACVFKQGKHWDIGSVEVPANCRPYLGADWGFSVDPTVLVQCRVIGDRTLYVESEVYQIGCEIDRTPALFDKIEGSRKWPIIADSARPETISYMRNHGFPNIMAARKGAGSVEEGVEFLKSFDIVVHPNCTHAIDELTLYAYKVDGRTNEVLPVLEDRKNHVIDALRYAVESLRRGLSTAITVPFVHSIPRAMPGH